MKLTFERNCNGFFKFYSQDGILRLNFCSDFNKVSRLDKGVVTLAKKNPKKKGFKEITICPGRWFQLLGIRHYAFPDTTEREWLQQITGNEVSYYTPFSFYIKIEA